MAKAATTGSRTTRPRRAAKKAVMVTDTVARLEAEPTPASQAAARFAAAVAATTAYAETSPKLAEPAPPSTSTDLDAVVDKPVAPPSVKPATPIFGRRGTGLASRRSTAAAIRLTPDAAPPTPASPPVASATSAGATTRSTPAPRTFAARWLSTIDALPPIKLPIGPAIPWRFGLPAVVALVVCMALLSRPTAHAEGSTFRLPAESETYPVTQDAPLFAASQADKTPPAQPIGVADPPALGVDVLDLTLKLVAVLALAYGSLTLLKRTRLGGGAAPASGGSLEGLRIISTLNLAPNRSVHVVRAPGGKTLLLGATPGQVNLIADLGQVSEADLSGATTASTFFDVLAGKLNPSS